MQAADDVSSMWVPATQVEDPKFLSLLAAIHPSPTWGSESVDGKC